LAASVPFGNLHNDNINNDVVARAASHFSNVKIKSEASATINAYYSNVAAANGADEVLTKSKTIQSQHEYLQNNQSDRITKRRTERALEFAENLKSKTENLKSKTENLEDVNYSQHMIDEFRKEQQTILNKINECQKKLDSLRQDIPEEKTKRLKRLVDISSVEDELNTLKQKYSKLRQLSSTYGNNKDESNNGAKETDKNDEQNIDDALDVSLAFHKLQTKIDSDN